jgi:hypothetical protein
VLKRIRGREIEKWLSMPIIPEVDFIGKADLISISLGEIHDHKTLKKKKYALSLDKLATDEQMLDYAHYIILRRPDLPQVLIRQNYFLKDHKNPQVFVRETFVDRDQIEAHWHDVVIPTAREMLKLQEDFNKPGYTWEEIPQTGTLCNAYGGCPFQHLCSGTESFDACKNRLERMSKSILKNMKIQRTETFDRINKEIPKNMEAQKMGIFDRMKKSESADPAPAPAPDSTPSPDSTLSPDSPKEQTPPSWAQPDCKACEGTGYNSKGKPCRICQQVSRAFPERTGILNSKTQPEESKPVEVPPAPAVTPPESPRRRGRPRKNPESAPSSSPNKFDLYINCAPIKGKKAYLLEEILASLEAELEKEDPKKYRELEVFKKRDLILSVFKLQVIPQLPSAVVAHTDTPLLKELAALLRGFAKVVIEGLK